MKEIVAELPSGTHDTAKAGIPRGNLTAFGSPAGVGFILAYKK